MEAATLTSSARQRRPLAPDEQLVAATRVGDDRAFETLYHRYHRRIAAYVLGMVKDHQRAEDVTQEVFLSALRRMRATDREIVFKPWVYEIAKNACIDQHRRSRRADEVSYDAREGGAASLVSGRPGPDEAAASRAQLDDLCGALRGLSESHHQILVLRELEGRSYEEIAERLQMTRPAVESTLHRARKRLGEEYGELVSGERCRQVQTIIATAGEAALGVRDRRTMARHVSHCQPCRRVATMAGLSDLVPTRTGARAKIAALLPLPAFLRDRWLGVGSQHAASAADGGGAAGTGLMGWLHAAAPMADTASTWTKAAVAAATVAVAGTGAGVVATQGGGGERPAGTSPPATAPATGAAPTSVAATRPAATRSRATAPARTHKRASGPTTASRSPAPAPAPVTVGASSGLGERGQAARGGAPAKPGGGAGSGGSGIAGSTSTLPATPAAPAVSPATNTAGATTTGVQGTVTSVAQGTQAATTTSTPVPPAAPVVDTQVTVPSLPDVTQQVGQTVDQTLQTTQGVVNGVLSGVQGAATGLGDLTSGG